MQLIDYRLQNLSLYVISIIFMITGILFTALPATAMAQPVSSSTGAECHILGMVFDRYGIPVPGAEVRLTNPDGTWCEIPDNPVVSAISEPGEDGFFEYVEVSPGQYILSAAKDGYTGSVAIAAQEGENYVELTIPEYAYRSPVQAAGGSSVPAIDAAITQLPQPAATGSANVTRTENVLPDLWRIVLGVAILLSGMILAAIVLIKR